VCVRLRQSKTPPTSNANTHASANADARANYLPALQQPPQKQPRSQETEQAGKQAGKQASCCISVLHSPSFPQHPTPNTHYPLPTTRHPSWYRLDRRTHAELTLTLTLTLTPVRVVQPHPFPPASTSSGPSCYFHLTSQLVLPHLPLQTFPATCSFTPRLAPPSPRSLALLPFALCLLQCLAGAWSQS
jgi:hypothetical protein